MVEHVKKASSVTSKVALGFALGGSALGLINAGTNGGSPFSALTNRGLASPGTEFVTEKDLKYVREISEKDSEIATLKSQKYTDQRIVESVAPIYGELSKLKDEMCDIKSALTMETERRACGDANLQTYVDGNFIKAEKSLNSKHINYHGCEAIIKPTHNCCC